MWIATLRTILQTELSLHECFRRLYRRVVQTAAKGPELQLYSRKRATLVYSDGRRITCSLVLASEGCLEFSMWISGRGCRLLYYRAFASHVLLHQSCAVHSLCHAIPCDVPSGTGSDTCGPSILLPGRCHQKFSASLVARCPCFVLSHDQAAASLGSFATACSFAGLLRSSSGVLCCPPIPFFCCVGGWTASPA